MKKIKKERGVVPSTFPALALKSFAFKWDLLVLSTIIEIHILDENRKVFVMNVICL